MKKVLSVAITLGMATQMFGQKIQSFTITRNIGVSIEHVWKIVGEEYADIAKAHPRLTSSHFVEGTPTTGDGCERVCNLSDDGNKYTRERIIEYNEREYGFKAEILEVGGLPIDADHSYMIYKLEKVDERGLRVG